MLYPYQIMYNEAFRQLQAEDVSSTHKLEALRKLASITTRAPWRRTLLLQETLRQIAAASKRIPVDVKHLAAYWQYVTSCVECRQIQPQHVAQILTCAARMPLHVSSSEAPHLDCLLLTLSEWKFRLPQREATELLASMLDSMRRSDPDVLTRQHKVIVRCLCHAHLFPQHAVVKSLKPLEALRNFVQHLLPAFSLQKGEERDLGMIALRSFVHDCRAFIEKQVVAHFLDNIHLISRHAKFFTSSLLLPVSALPVDPHVLVKRGRKPHQLPDTVDAKVETQNAALALTVLTSCLQRVPQQDVQQVLQSITMVLVGKMERSENHHGNSRAEVARSLPSSVLKDVAFAITSYISSNEAPVPTQCLALESLCATSMAAGHIREVQQHLLKAILSSHFREIQLREKERLISLIFKASSNRTGFSELLKILTPALASFNEKTASQFCSAEVLRNLGASVMSLPRTHSTTCLQILYSASERAHPIVFVVVAAIMEAVPFVDFDASFAVAVRFLNVNTEKTSDDTYCAMKLYLIGTLIITKYRQRREISLSDVQSFFEWLDDNCDAKVERENWQIRFVERVNALASGGAKSRMATERLVQILTFLHRLQENVSTSNIEGLVSTLKSDGHSSECGETPNGTIVGLTGGQFSPQMIFGAPHG